MRWTLEQLNSHPKRDSLLGLFPPAQPAGAPTPAKKGAWKQGWYIIGTRRIYMRSRWEVNYAFYLEMLITAGEVVSWDYEAETFWFDGIKRGTTSYTPDFKVMLKDGRTEYHEIKGWMDPKSLTKIKRMKKYHPEITLVVRDSAWFKEHRALKGSVPGWV